MKNIKFLGIAAIIAAIVFTMAACAGLTLVSLDNESVTGPAQVRQFGTIDPNEITVYGFYKDDSRKRVSINKNDVTFDGGRAGPQTVNVKTSVGTVSFQTEVMELTEITVASQPAQALFKIGEERNAAWPGLVIRGDWNGMGSDTIPTASCQITGYSAEPAGRKTITVTYNGKTATFNVEVLALTSIELEKPPTKIDYSTGESLNLAGIVVQGNYGAGGNRIREAIPQNQLTASGYESGRVGQQRVTVTVRGQSAAFNVTVTQSINGTWGMTLALNGTTYTYRFNNGSYTYTMTNSATIGTMTFQGTYTANDGRISTTVTQFNPGQTFAADTPPGYGIPSRLYTRNELEAAFANGSETAKSLSADTIKLFLDAYYSTSTGTYSLSGNTLTITPTREGAQPEVYTKR